MVIRWVIVGTSSNTISMTDWTRFWRPTVSNDGDEHWTCALIKSTRVLCHDCDPKISTRTASPRNANIVTTIEVSEGGEVRVWPPATRRARVRPTLWLSSPPPRPTSPIRAMGRPSRWGVGDSRSKKLTSTVKRSIGSTIGFYNHKAPTRAFSWLKAPTSAFTFKTLLRQC